ncbi:exocyst complex component EXO70H1-like [Corylus avellana]|uniref:exocyst complex component EXO70H1-like n=1 Tax=Corylus avellana TaxID=13451 RepID=UPI001E2189D3|nr:exocyst complex component EXO70H1-like [Corylus avellana]
MPRKGMRSIWFHSRAQSFSVSRHSSPARPSSVSTPSRTLSDTMTEQSIEAAAALVTKWDPESSTYAKVTSLFYESKAEAMEFIKCVNDLQKAMHALVSGNSTSDRLVHAQNLMQIAMKRLQKEFYQILSMNRAHLDPESVSARSSRTSARSSISDYEDDEDVRTASDAIDEVEEVSSIAMADLRSIAECMISAGYAKECLSIYKIIRKSIVDEGIYRLGVEKLSSSQINKMNWETLEMKIRSWLSAVKISLKTLLHGERILCDHVFASSDSIRESCFAEISKEGAILLFGFPEAVAKSKSPKSPEKIFRVLDMYTAISENWPEIESIFALESTATVRSQALASLIRITESVRAMVSGFESTIQKDSHSKSLVRGGGVHPLTLDAMNCLSNLADYSHILEDIFAEWPPPPRSSLPESYFDTPQSDDSQAPAISLRMAWLILVLLCKLDGKAEHYKDVSLSYIFLTNNLQHVVSKVRTSNLQYLLGDEWITRHEAKARQFATNYERLAWGKVGASLPENPTAVISPAEAKEIFRKFNSSFEDACQKHRTFVVSDPKLRDEIKVSLARKLVPVYREFYETHRLTVGGERNVGSYVRFAPEDVGNHLSDLFFGTTESVSSPSSSSSSSHRRRSLFRP